MTSFNETTCVIHTPDRYIAHAEIDRQWIDFPREGSRFWRYGIFQVDSSSSIAVIRTNDSAGIGGQWQTVHENRDEICGVVLCSPKKTSQFSAFRDDEFAHDFFMTRLSAFGEVSNLSVRQAFTIPIKRNPKHFTMPARYAFFSIETSSVDMTEKLLGGHVGGAAAFGMGMVITDNSKAWKIVSSLADNY